MAAPRQEAVEVEKGECPEHGEVEFRRHKVGVRNGVQRYRLRCPRCHSKSVTKSQGKASE